MVTLAFENDDSFQKESPCPPFLGEPCSNSEFLVQTLGVPHFVANKCAQRGLGRRAHVTK